MRLPQAQLGSQGLGTRKDLTQVKSSLTSQIFSSQYREPSPEGPPQWDALMSRPGSRRVSIGEERGLTINFMYFLKLVPVYTRAYQRKKSEIRVKSSVVRHVRHLG